MRTRLREWILLRRRAIDTAPRSDIEVRKPFGRKFEAEHTDAGFRHDGLIGDSSMTDDEIGGQLVGLARGNTVANQSAARCFGNSVASVRTEPSQSPRFVADTRSRCRAALPMPSTTATFTPVRIPGSRPSWRVARRRREQQVAGSIRRRESSASASSQDPCFDVRFGMHTDFHVQRTVSSSHASAGRPAF